MKQVIVLRSDLDMSTGKLIAQACHASLGAMRNASRDVVEAWEASGATKVAVKINGEDALRDRVARAQREDLPAYVVQDAGRTEVAAGTVTAAGIGPGKDTAIDKVTKDLSLM